MLIHPVLRTSSNCILSEFGLSCGQTVTPLQLWNAIYAHHQKTRRFWVCIYDSKMGGLSYDAAMKIHELTVGSLSEELLPTWESKAPKLLIEARALVRDKTLLEIVAAAPLSLTYNRQMIANPHYHIHGRSMKKNGQPSDIITTIASIQFA